MLRAQSAAESMMAAVRSTASIFSKRSGAVIGFEEHSLGIHAGHMQKNAFPNQSQRRIVRFWMFPESDECLTPNKFAL